MAVKRMLKTENGFISSYKRVLRRDFQAINKISKAMLPKTQEYKETSQGGLVWTNHYCLSNNGDGSLTALALNTTYPSWFWDFNISTTSGHQYVFKGCPKGGSANISYWIEGVIDPNSGANQHFYDEGGGAWFIAGGSLQIRICVCGNTSESGIIFKPQLFDLTELYGAGDEPTVGEFESKFGTEYIPHYYDYHDAMPPCLVSHNHVIAGNSIQKWQPSRVGGSVAKEGITLTTDKVNGTITISGVCTKDASNFSFSQTYYIQNHIYFARTGLKGTTSPLTQFGFGYTGFTIDKPVIFLQHRATGYIYDLLYCNKGTDFSTPQTIRPELYDLTEIFGAGNEPTTVEEAEAILGKGYIPYQHL